MRQSRDLRKDVWLQGGYCFKLISQKGMLYKDSIRQWFPLHFTFTAMYPYSPLISLLLLHRCSWQVPSQIGTNDNSVFVN